MTFQELRKKEGKMSGLLALGKAVPPKYSSLFKNLLLLGFPFLMVALLSYEWWAFFPVDVLYGLMFLDIAGLLIIFMIDCFYYSHYFAGMHTVLPEWGMAPHTVVLPYEVGEIVSQTPSGDLTRGFLQATAGRDIFARLNISEEVLGLFLRSERRLVYADSVLFNEPVTLVSYATAVFDADKALSHFLGEHGVGRNEFVGTSAWVADMYEKRKEVFRWWGRDSLGRIRGIGKDWTKHEAEVLERFCYFAEPRDEESVYKKEISAIEKSLAHGEGRKVLFVADEYRKLEAILSGLAGRISDGVALPQLQHKKLLVLDAVKLDETAQADGRFQILLGEIFAEAILAGDIVMVIKNFPFLIFAAKKRGISLSDLLAPYLSSHLLGVVALSTHEAHDELIKPDKKLMSGFAHMYAKTEDREIILRTLQRKVGEVERKSELFFTYQSLATLTDIAMKTKGEHMAEYRALGLFIEIIPKLVKKNLKIVTVSDVIVLAR